jgi:hypothetical protein
VIRRVAHVQGHQHHLRIRRGDEVDGRVAVGRLTGDGDTGQRAEQQH